jgi:deoxyribonuclease IV
MRFAAHVRRGTEATRGVVQGCRDRGADGAQIFVSNPRAWRGPTLSPSDAEAFRAAWTASGLGPLVAHAPYVVNIASPNDTTLVRSRLLAVATVQTCEAMGVDALVLHSGAGGPGDPASARERAAVTLREVVRAAGPVRVLVELMAGTAGAVASTAEEADALLRTVEDDRVGLCLDTCHLFATGYDLDSTAGVATSFEDFASRDLLPRVGLIHANDSMYPSGEHRDRHANIGEGKIGLEGFRAILARPEAAGWTFVLETPGDPQSHAEQIATLRSLART